MKISLVALFCPIVAAQVVVRGLNSSSLVHAQNEQCESIGRPPGEVDRAVNAIRSFRKDSYKSASDFLITALKAVADDDNYKTEDLAGTAWSYALTLWVFALPLLVGAGVLIFFLLLLCCTSSQCCKSVWQCKRCLNLWFAEATLVIPTGKQQQFAERNPLPVGRRVCFLLAVLAHLAGIGVTVGMGIRWAVAAEESAKAVGCSVLTSVEYIVLGTPKSDPVQFAGLVGLTDRVAEILSSADMSSPDYLPGRLETALDKKALDADVSALKNRLIASLALAHLPANDVSRSGDGFHVAVVQPIAAALEGTVETTIDQQMKPFDEGVRETRTAVVEGIEMQLDDVRRLVDENMIGASEDISRVLTDVALEVSDRSGTAGVAQKGAVIGTYAVAVVVSVFAGFVVLFVMCRPSSSPVPACVSWGTLFCAAVIFFGLSGILLIAGATVSDAVTWTDREVLVAGGFDRLNSKVDIGGLLGEAEAAKVVTLLETCFTPDEGSSKDLVGAFGINGTSALDEIERHVDLVGEAVAGISPLQELMAAPIRNLWDIIGELAGLVPIDPDAVQRAGEAFRLRTWPEILETGLQQKRATFQVAVDALHGLEDADDVTDNLHRYNDTTLNGVEEAEELISPFFFGSLHEEDMGDEEKWRMTESFVLADPKVMEAMGMRPVDEGLAYQNALYWAHQKEILRGPFAFNCPAVDTPAAFAPCSFDEFATWVREELATDAVQQATAALAAVDAEVDSMRTDVLDLADDAARPLRDVVEKANCGGVYAHLTSTRQQAEETNGFVLLQGLGCLFTASTLLGLAGMMFLLWRFQSELILAEALAVRARKSREFSYMQRPMEITV